MTSRWRRIRPDDRVAALLEPVGSQLRSALGRLPPGPDLTVRMGAVDGFAAVDDGDLVLSDALEGPSVQHPDEGRFGLDRWRRAVACILEEHARQQLARELELQAGDDWRWRGAAIDIADWLAPDLQLSVPDLALAVRTGDPGAHPRAGVAVLRAWRAQGHDAWKRIRYVIDGGVISAKEWLTLGRWILQEANSQLPAPEDRPAPRDVPLVLKPWCWQPLRVPAHPRGGEIEVDGDGLVADPWGVAGEVLETVAGSAEGGCSLGVGLGGPTGRWEVASAEGFGQVLGARGVTFDFHPSGSLDIVMADAFVGPLAAVAMSDEVGTSGTASARWGVAGQRRLRFREISVQGATLHGRQRDRFAMPAQGFGLAEWLHALGEDVWAWKEHGDRLLMRGRMLGGGIEIRFRREA